MLGASAGGIVGFVCANNLGDVDGTQASLASRKEEDNILASMPSPLGNYAWLT